MIKDENADVLCLQIESVFRICRRILLQVSQPTEKVTTHELTKCATRLREPDDRVSRLHFGASGSLPPLRLDFVRLRVVVRNAARCPKMLACVRQRTPSNSFYTSLKLSIGDIIDRDDEFFVDQEESTPPPPDLG